MIKIIVAVAQNNVIGNNNKLIWHLSEDLKHFKQLTTGHPVIMGRKTYESIGKPLPNRTNIIISSNVNYNAQGCIVVNSFNEALYAAGNNDVFIIGGESIYKQAMPMAHELYITKIHYDYEGDTYFPEITKDWLETERIDFEKGEKFPHPFSFCKYKRQL